MARGPVCTSLFAIHIDDLDFYFLPNLKDLLGMLDSVPGKFGEMHQAIRTLDVHKGAKICKAGHTTGEHIPFIQFVDYAFFYGLAGFVACCPFRADQAAAGSVYFNDTYRDGIIDHLRPALFGRIT